MYRPTHAPKTLTRVVGVVLFYFAATAAAIGFRRWDLTRRSNVADTSLGPIEWAEAGQGPPVLVLHGTPGGSDTGLVAAEGLRPFRKIAISRTGYEQSVKTQPVPASERITDEARRMAALLDYLGIQSVSVLAYSGGGPFALAFAIDYPERCRALALIAAETRPDPETAGVRRLRRLREELFAGSDLLTAIPVLLAPGRAGRIARSLTPVVLRRSGMILDEEAFAQFPNLQMEQIRCPVLLVHGKRDRVVPFADAQAAAFLIRHAELLALDGGHLAAMRMDSDVTRRITSFLSLPPSR